MISPKLNQNADRYGSRNWQPPDSQNFSGVSPRSAIVKKQYEGTNASTDFLKILVIADTTSFPGIELKGKRDQRIRGN
jgi:hypothetical protein